MEPGPGGRLFLETFNFESWYKKYTKNQEASYNFRLGFVLSNRPHLHRAYLIIVQYHLILAVVLFRCTSEISVTNQFIFLKKNPWGGPGNYRKKFGSL